MVMCSCSDVRYTQLWLYIRGCELVYRFVTPCNGCTLHSVEAVCSCSDVRYGRLWLWVRVVMYVTVGCGCGFVRWSYLDYFCV